MMWTRFGWWPLTLLSCATPCPPMPDCPADSCWGRGAVWERPCYDLAPLADGGAELVPMPCEVRP